MTAAMREQPIVRAPMRRGREKSMDLPVGWTCGGCQHFKRCNAMFGHIAQDETCDWSPSRFAPSMALVTRALEIADVAMFELLDSECVVGDEYRTVFGLIDESYEEVKSLAAAAATIQEAFAWLHPRGYVELGTDNDGEFINVIRRPQEE